MNASLAIVDDLVLRALDLPVAERDAYLDRKCGDDGNLRTEVEELLSVRTSALWRAEKPAFELLPRASDEDPRQLGPYAIEAKLGEGGTSVVYRGIRQDGSDNRPVAIKLLKRGMDSEEILRRLEQEGHILSSLHHPNIGRVFGGGSNRDRRPYLVMELIDGLPVDSYCRRHDLTLRDRARLLLPACAAIAHAHRSLVVHRDLKPDNILVSQDGQLHILDFGISKLLDAESGKSLTFTAPGMRMLTPEYAAPEQLAMGETTTAIDIYSLGVILYELLTGQRPIQRQGSHAAFLRQVLDAKPLPPSEHASEVPADLDSIVLKALEKEPAKRYLSVAELGRDLRRFLEGRPVAARGRGLAYRAGKMARRHWKAFSAMALLALATGAVLVERELAQRELVLETRRAKAAEELMLKMLVDSDPFTTTTGPVTVEGQIERALQDRELLQESPRLHGTLLQAYGRLLGNRGGLQEGDLERGYAMVAEGGELIRAALPPDDPRVGESEIRQGDYLLHLERFEESALHMERGLELLEAAPQSGLTDVLEAKASLARLRFHQGELESGERLAHEVLEALGELSMLDARQRSLHIETSLFASFFQKEKGSWAGAKKTLSHAVALAVEEWGDRDMRVLYLRRDLAQVTFKEGQWEEGIRLSEEAAALTREVLGAENKMYVQTLLQLGNLLHEAGRADEAQARVREALMILQSSGNPDPKLLTEAQGLLVEKS